jgi:hypothetical protein
LIVPSVTQEDYYVEVTRINASASLNDAGLYDLELENYPAPMPNLIELPARDQNTELNDTGTVVLDDVTRRSNPEILVHADLTDFIAQGIPLLNPAAATAGNQPGVAVELFVDGQSVGFAAVVPDTANTLFRFELTSAALQAAGFPADSLGELYFVSAATRVFDLQENAAGVAAPATGRTLLAEPLRLHVDSTPPAGSVPDLIDSSDSGWHQDDNVTAIATPTFQGTAEHNAIVRLFVQNVTDPQNPGPWEFVGQTVAGSDLTDGTSGTPNGSTIDHAGIWQITASPLDDLADESTAFFASYQVRTEIEDLAGNVATTDSLQIWVDRREPALPSLDLVAEHDSGRHNDDDVTNVNQPTLAITLNDTPQGGTNPFPNQLFYRLYDRFTPPGEMVTDGEQLLHQGPLDSLGFTRLDLQTLGITLADGAHELRLQAEDLAGNVSHSYVLQLVIDTQAPAATVQLDPDSDTGVWGYPATMQDRITSDKSPRLVGTAEANTVVRAVINGTPAGTSVAVPIDGNHAFPPPPGYVGNYQLDTILSLADGLQQVELYVEDLAGNGRDQVAATLDFFVDTQGPRITNITWGDVSRRGTFTFDENTTSVFRPKPAGGPDPLISSIVVHLHDLPERTEQFNPAALWEALVAEEGHFRLVGDANGEIPILATILRRIENAADGGARATIELVFHDPGADRQLFTADDRGAPLPDDRLTLTISDTLTDPAGNSLDGESGAAAPFAGANVPDPTPPVFPTGDGQHGGTFDARFTVDSRAELGVWSAGSVYLDLNGNFQFDPASGDAVNRDVAHTFGLTSDYIFAGNFPDNGVADGYDKLAAYGNVDGRFRWLVDVNNDANPDIRQFDAANLVGMPIAGRFNRELSGDQVGLFTSTHWYVDANGDVMLAGERARASGMTGLPVAGDFDRDGIQDLATWDVRENRFQISLSTAGGGLANPQRFRQFTLDAGFPFIGVRERPVAADFDGDGYDDLGLWVPDRSGAAPDEMAEWFLLLSHGAPVTSRIRNDAIKFTPVPFGPDIYAQYGDQFGVPVVGNFDPPSVLVVGASEGADDGAGAGAGTGAGTSASAGAGTSPSTSTGTGTGTSTGTSTSTGAGAGTSTGTGTSPSTGAGAGTGTSASTGAGTGTEGNSTFDARDVNRDGSITPRDALLVLNEVNRAWSAAADESVVIELRLDVNADGFVTPRDALLILNHINSESAAPQQASIAVESRSAELSAFEFAAAADQIFADNVLRVSRR